MCCVPTEVGYSTKFYPEPTPDGLNDMGNAEKDVSGIIEGSKYWNLRMKNGKINYSPKRELYTIKKKRGIILPLRQKNPIW